MPKISIIVPVYNVGELVSKCVNSLLSQTFTDFEIILVDDGSTDDSGKLCDSFKDERIKVFHKENGGLSDARNYGIDRAEGEYLTFIDSDDYVKETYLEELYMLLKKHAECKVSACNHIIVRGDKEENNANGDGILFLDRKSAFESALYHKELDVSAWGKLYCRSVFKTLRFPKGRLYEDTYVFGEVLKNTKWVVYGYEPQYYYVQRSTSIIAGQFSEKRLEFIDSAKRFTDTALELYPELESGCVRRMTHAYLSVLRYMGNCDKEYYPLRKELRSKILENKAKVLADRNTPKRDRLAIMMLSVGLWFFFKAWTLYEKIR